MTSSPIPCRETVLNPAYLPNIALYEPKDSEASQAGATAAIGWSLSPVPFELSQSQADALLALGPALLKFLEALDTLYKHSVSQAPVKGLTIPEWVRDYFHQGKPEALIQFAQMKRFRTQLPIVIRPDLLITADGFALTEIDAVPGGLGFISALNEAYRKSGFPLIEGRFGKDNNESSLPEVFLEALKSQASDVENPAIGIIVSDEAQDYLKEWQWLISNMQQAYPHIHVLHPRQIHLSQDSLVANLESGETVKLDVIYRFFELFDLPNIPQMDLIQYALKKRLVQGTPPFKTHLEDKMMMAFFHHPSLEAFWKGQLDKSTYALLQQYIPKTWIVDPAPLPPHAVIANLNPGGQPMQSFKALGGLSQKARELVLKPSGFSPLAWGSKGVTIGHDASAEQWQERIEEALTSFPKTPYILQEFRNPVAKPFYKLDLSDGSVKEFQAKTRLCPYYIVIQDESGNPTVSLSGILATACPSDKKIIHGMRDAVLAPCAVSPEPDSASN